MELHGPTDESAVVAEFFAGRGGPELLNEYAHPFFENVTPDLAEWFLVENVGHFFGVDLEDTTDAGNRVLRAHVSSLDRDTMSRRHSIME